MNIDSFPAVSAIQFEQDNLAPAYANRAGIAQSIPLPAPVTATHLPSNRRLSIVTSKPTLVPLANIAVEESAEK